MALVSAAWVRRRLSRLSPDAFAAFVAALWEARGAETRMRDGGRVVEVRRDGRVESLRVVTGRRPPSDLDERAHVVCSRPAAELRGETPATVTDADDLHTMLLYAVPREDARAICQRFLDGPLVRAASTPHEATSPRLPESSGTVAVALLGVVLVVASVFGGPMFGDGVLESSFGAPPSVGSDAVADTTSTPSSPTTNDGPEADRSGALPPGLTSDGAIDEERLADTHATTLTGHSYRLTLTYREFVDGRPTAYRREVIYVASPTEYRTTVEGAGELRAADMVISSVEAYADGESRYEHRVTDDRIGSGTARTSAVRGVQNGEGRYADRVETYLGWYLSVSESSLVDVVERDGTRYFWVSLGADPYPGVENSTGSALIDEHGIVHEVGRYYDVPGQAGLSAEVTIRYTDIDRTTVEPPEWYLDRTTTPTPANTTASTSTTSTNTTTSTPTATNATAAASTATTTPASG